MSQNKTIVPDVDYDNTGNNEYDETVYGSLYTRSGNDDNHTCIADTSDPIRPSMPNASTVSSMAAATETRAIRQITMENRVIVGCLFSISHGLLGEMFPVYLGRNVIGQAEGCDVWLRERTVSSEHAVLYVRKEGNPVRYSMTIMDYNSANGTEVNGRDGRYETLPVQENDVIGIGRHYKLLVKLFNVEEAKLEEDEEFEETGRPLAADSFAADNNYRTPDTGIDCYSPSRNNDSESSRTMISDMY